MSSKGEVMLVQLSRHNQKTKCFTTRTESASCPSTCPMRSACYAKAGPISWHWASMRGAIPWATLCDVIRGLPTGEPIRLNDAGDLPHSEGNICAKLALDLASACHGKRAWAYTHHTTTPHNVAILRAMSHLGVTVSLSCESLTQCDTLQHIGLPLAVVVRDDSVRYGRTPSGMTWVLCPHTTGRVASCRQCMLCYRKVRAIVAFPLHGALKGRVKL